MTTSFKHIAISLLVAVAVATGASAAEPEGASAALPAASPEMMVAEADTAYVHGDYDKAVELYDAVISKTGASASLLYNLGNAYYRSGNEGEARLCLERAKRLDPSNEAITQNIAYLATRIEDANKAEMKGKKGSVSPDEIGFFGRINRSISVDTASNSWAGMALMAFILLVLALALYFFSTNVRLKKIGFFSALIFLFFSVIFVVFAEMAAAHFESKDEAVLTQFKLTLSAEPETDAPAVGFPLHRGTKFHIHDSELNADGEVGWYKVELNHNNVGWVPADAVAII